MGKKVSDEEKKFIVDNFESMTIVSIAHHLGRRSDHIGGIARKLGLRKLDMVQWNEEEEFVLREFFPNYGAKGCIELLQNRTHAQIHWKAKRLGLYCDITQQRINYGIKHNDFEINRSYGSGGYIVVKIDGVLKYEHKVIAERHLGRSLNADEVVHHVNEIKDDNRLENLAVLSRSDHMKLHRHGDSGIVIVPLVA
jgi:hypothetical protein